MRLFQTTILILFISAFFSESGYTQGKITKENYEELSKKLDYNKTRKIWVRKRSGRKKFTTRKVERIASKSHEGLSAIISILGYILLGIIVLGILYVVLRDLKSEKIATEQGVDLDNIEDIQAIDLEQLLKQALGKMDFRLALRLKFLMVIKALTQEEKLEWRPYKTNRVYVNELRSTPYMTGFRQLADIFEDIWYGVSSINGEEYELFRPKFDNFLNNFANE